MLLNTSSTYARRPVENDKIIDYMIYYLATGLLYRLTVNYINETNSIYIVLVISTTIGPPTLFQVNKVWFLLVVAVVTKGPVKREQELMRVEKREFA